ncbi:hypothetical protein BsWGS_10568 [Bradybaena similaris]
MLHRYLQSRCIAGNSSVNRLSPALDLSFLLPKLKNFSTDEYTTMDNDGMSVPPLACGFAKMPQHQHVVAVVDEDGYLVLYNTHKTGQAAVIKTWQVHANAVFDLEWSSEENKLLTASGDQTVVLYDVETCQRLDIFRGHASSVKSISNKVYDNAVFASGSRDGHIMMWDKRIYHKTESVPPVDTIFHAHMLQHQNFTKTKQKRQIHLVKDVQQSVTVVLFQNENYLISAGAGDGCLKVWDVRKTYRRNARAQPVHIFPYPGVNTRKYGYSSLVLESQGRRLFASCTDDVIYEYDMASFNPEPVQTWRGHKNSTFYVKSAMSPDDQYLISGSSDEMAYIWQINKPHAAPIALKCHTAEVTSVSWCPNDITKVVTLSDDEKTKFWRIFCRELKKNYLPPWLGQAKKTSKGLEYSRVTEDEVPGTSTPSSPNMPIPNKASLQKSGSPQACIHTWLKRKAPSIEVAPDSGTVPEKIVCKNDQAVKASTSVQDNMFLKAKEEVISKSFPAANVKIKFISSCDNANSSKNVSLPSKDTSSDSTSATSKKRSYEESEALLPSDSYVHLATTGTKSCTAEQTEKISAESISSKRLKVEHSQINSEEEKGTKQEHQDQNSYPSYIESSHVFLPKIHPRSPVKSALGSPSKSRTPVRQEDSENVSPVKLKRMLNSAGSPTSPKRPCLTNLNSNFHQADACSVKVSLFADGKLQDNSDSLTNCAQQNTNKPLPLCSKSHEADVRLESDTNNECETKVYLPTHSQEETCLALKNTPPTERLECAESIMLLKDKNIQNKDDTDFYSPTRNLPNLVMDEPHTCVSTPPKSHQRNQKHNWLSLIRLQKLKKSPQMVPVQTNQGKLSPKVTKGMRKINSYFK